MFASAPRVGRRARSENSRARVRSAGRGRTVADRGARGRLLLGCAGRLSASQGREERAVRIRRRCEARRPTTKPSAAATPGHAEVRADRLRPGAGDLRADPAGVLLGGARSHAAQPAGTGFRHAVSIGDLLRERRAEEDRERLHRAARRGAACIREPHRYARRSAATASTRPRTITRTTCSTIRPARTSSFNDLPKVRNFERDAAGAVCQPEPVHGASPRKASGAMTPARPTEASASRRRPAAR